MKVEKTEFNSQTCEEILDVEKAVKWLNELKNANKRVFFIIRQNFRKNSTIMNMRQLFIIIDHLNKLKLKVASPFFDLYQLSIMTSIRP